MNGKRVAFLLLLDTKSARSQGYDLATTN